VLAKVSITAPIWAAAALTLVATAMAWLWLPETVHRATAGTGNPLKYLPGLFRRPIMRRVMALDFVYWFAFSIFQTTFSLFAARRFGFDASRTGYFFAGFGVLGAVIQGGFIRPIVRRAGDKPTFMAGIVCSVIGLVAAAFAHSVPMFALALVPLAFGMGLGHPTISSLISRSARGDEQGRVQGAAGAVESLGRTFGPVWGNGSLQRYGEATPFLTGAAFLAMTLLIVRGYHVADDDEPVNALPTADAEAVLTSP
jgi:DHA1 family tetracycline resistance protein-like MFS transporter